MAISSVSPTARSLNTVQAVLRLMVWLGALIVLGGLTALVSVAVAAVSAALASVVLAIGGFVSFVLSILIARSLYVIPEYQRVVILKLGKFVGVKGPGLFWVVPYPPFYQSVAAKLDIRIQTRVIQAAKTLTADNVPVGCEAVVFLKVEDPERAALQVENYSEAVFQAANSALKDTIGTLELTQLLGEREMVAQKLEAIIDRAASSFGIDVASVEITDVHVPNDLIQELSVLAQSRRSAQAKIAEAAAEKEVAQKLEEASREMGPVALEMYRLNVLERLGREEGSQIVIYGMGGSNPEVGSSIASAAAGSLVSKAPITTPATGET